MKRLTFLMALLAASAASGVVRAEPVAEQRRSVVVLPLEAAPDLGVDLDMLRQRVELTLRDEGTLEVFGPGDLSELASLAETNDRLGCAEQAKCLAQLTNLVGRDLVVIGKLGRVGQSYALNLRLIDGRGTEVLGRQGGKVDAPSELSALAADLAKKLLSAAGVGAGERLAISLSALGPSPTLAVLGLKAQGVDEVAAASLGDALVVELGAFEGVRVFSREDLDALLAVEARKQLTGCDDISCMAEIGGALGARYIATGTVSRLEQKHFVNVRIVDTRKMQVIASEQESFLGPADELVVGMRFLVRRMFGVPYEGQGRLRLKLSHGGVTLRVDGVESDEVPEKLTAGRHLVEIEKSGFYPFTRETYVEPARTSGLDVRLQEIPVPWYRSWWVWTLAGVVVAGVTTTAVVLSQQGDGGATPENGGGVVNLP